MNTEERVAVITGSSRGIGAALATHLAEVGFRVVVNYAESAAQAQQVYEDITAKVGPGRALCLKADVSHRAEVQALFDQTVREFGRVDVLINNAGINIDGPFMEMTDEQWDRVIGTHLTGTFICSQEFARRYTGDQGHILTTGANTAFRARLNGVNYCSAKAGIVMLTKCLALELAPRIRVNCVIPGLINTEEVMIRHHLDDQEHFDQWMRAIPLGRIGTPEDVCKMVHFLLCDGDYITGQNFFVNGGHLMV
jgi:NAD(P)-dependent dehydrogenase (short-subunit alcohol dehydrogenase family)